MPIRDIVAMNASLANDYGATHGPNAPEEHELAIFDGDPSVEGVEVAEQPRATVTNDAGWADPENGQVARVVPVQMPDATAAYDADYWALIAGGVMWDYGPLTEPLEVTEAGPGPLVSPVIFYDESVGTEF